MLAQCERHKVRRYRGRLSVLIGEQHAENCRHLLNDGRYRFRFSKPENKVMRRKKKFSPVEWPR